MSGWGCPYEEREYCNRLRRICEPGVKGCILQGKVTRLLPPIPDLAPGAEKGGEEKPGDRSGPAQATKND